MLLISQKEIESSPVALGGSGSIGLVCELPPGVVLTERLFDLIHSRWIAGGKEFVAASGVAVLEGQVSNG